MFCIQLIYVEKGRFSAPSDTFGPLDTCEEAEGRLEAMGWKKTHWSYDMGSMTIWINVKDLPPTLFSEAVMRLRSFCVVTELKEASGLDVTKLL